MIKKILIFQAKFDKFVFYLFADKIRQTTLATETLTNILSRENQGRLPLAMALSQHPKQNIDH